MKRGFLILVMLMVVVALIATGCNGGEEPTPEPTATPEGSPSATATPAETGEPEPTMGPLPSPGDVDPVNFSELIPYLPEAPAGWEAEEPDGFTGKFQDWWWSQASRNYTQSGTDNEASIVIFDNAYYYGFGWFQVWDMAFEIESTDMYMKRTTVDGYPAWETWYDPDEYSFMVLIDQRFFVMVNAESKSTLDSFSDLVNYDGIAGLQ